MSSFKILPAALLSLALGATVASAQPAPPAPPAANQPSAQGSSPQGNAPGMGGGMQMPMPGGMMGMMGGSDGCPMMKRMASVDDRLRRLEEKSGIPAPPTPPGAPSTPR